MKIKRAVGIICFLLIFLFLWQSIQAVFQDKWVNHVNGYARLKLFYEENLSPDVVFIGSSHVYCDINPLIIFQEQGISSYDFSSPDQSVEMTKLAVQEAIKTHSPKVIVIEPFLIMSLIRLEVRSRQGLDAIPLSLRKLATVAAIFEDNVQFNAEIEYDSMLSYAFPLLRYHGRWEELTSNDFVLDQNVPYYHGAIHYYGYGPSYRVVETNFNNYNDSVDFDTDQLAEAKHYFTDIVKMCRESGVGLLLLKAPSPLWRQGYHDLIAEWANEYDVPFVDYNEMMDEIGINVKTDFRDVSSHLNDAGTTKLSHYIGEYLRDHYELADHRGDPAYDSWNDDWQVYQQDKASYFLSNETDWTSYLEKLENPNYTIYMAARDSLGANKFPELTAQFKSIGLTPELDTAALTGYLAVIDGGQIILERIQDTHLAWSGQVNGHSVELASESWNLGNFASIKIDGVERGLNRRGINIVVYDNLLNDFVDCVTFDLWNGGRAYR